MYEPIIETLFLPQKHKNTKSHQNIYTIFSAFCVIWCFGVLVAFFNSLPF